MQAVCIYIKHSTYRQTAIYQLMYVMLGLQIKSPAYVGIAYALSQKTTGVRGLIVYIQNVILKGEIDEVVATMPELAPKLRVLQKVYDAFVAELVTTANQLQQDFAMEEGKARKGKWAKACQGLPKYMFNTLFRCHTETEPLDHAKLKGLLYDQYETMPSKIVGDMILQQLVPQYATEEEARVLTSADQGFDLQDEA